MRVSPPLWLNPPEIKRIPCTIQKRIEPKGYLVQLDVDGEQRSIVVPEDTVRVGSGSFPAKGNLLVVVVAELPDDDRLLTELPATPLSGSQRIKVNPQRLQPA